MAKKSGKGHNYPTHHVEAHPPPPHLTGSGNKSDGAYGKIRDKSARVVGRGTGGHYVIEDGSRTHKVANVQKSKHQSVPGHTEMRMFREGYDGCDHKVPMAFRAHRMPAGGKPRPGMTAHGHGASGAGSARGKSPSGESNSSYSPLRFSGHPGAHQVGKLSKGRTTFKDRETHVWGKSNLASSKVLPGNPNGK